MGELIATPRLTLTQMPVASARMLIAGHVPGVPAPVPDWPLDGTYVVAALVARSAAEEVELGPFGAYQIIRRTDGRVIGDCAFFAPPGADGEVMINIEIAPSARGQGFATEAICGLIAWAHQRSDIRAITAECQLGDEAGQRLLKRAGMRRAGVSEDTITFRTTIQAEPSRPSVAPA